MPDCFLHVGTHKTGSSAIQAFLLEKREQLLAHGVLVPSAGLPPNGNHVPLIRALYSPPAQRDQSLLASLTDEITKYSTHTVLLSSEHLEHHLRVRARSEVVDFFQSRGYTVKLVCVVRPQYERINSSYAQFTKAFRWNLNVNLYVSRALFVNSLFYSRWLRIAKEQDVELIAMAYSAAMRRDSIVPAFLRALGINGIAPPQREEYRKNLPTGTAAIAAARTCMDRLEARGLRLNQRQRTKCRMALEQAAAEVPSPPFWGLAPLAVLRIQDHYYGDNQYFALKAWRADWDEVFPPLEQDPIPNEIQRGDEGSIGHDAYAAIVERAWPAVCRIAQDPRLAKPEAWESDVAWSSHDFAEYLYDDDVV